MGPRTLAYRAHLIGMDVPCENTVYRMLACLSYARAQELTHAEYLQYRGTVRSAINAFPPRTIELPLTPVYPDSPAELDDVTRTSAYGTSLPPIVIIR